MASGSNATPRGVPRRILQGEGPRLEPVGASQIPTIQYSTGNAKALAEFSRNLFSLSNQFEDQLDAEAEAESASEGAVAGSTGNFELRTYGTIRGRAYNRAAIETFAATLDTDAMLQLSALQTQYWNDPDGFNRAWRDYTKGAADELRKFSPEQAAVFESRNTVRGIPAYEQAKDTQFKLTRSQADAALIEQETALRSMVKEVGADLFSENPERSRAAANSLGMIQRDFTSIYNAVGPDGRPLYSPAEIARAKTEFRDLAMKEAALSWYDEQPDKAAAYLQMTSGDFKIKLNNSNDHVNIIMANKGATRNDPLQKGLQEQLRAAAAATGDGLSIQVHSGGQETAEEIAASGRGRRTGSRRHDHGGAGDLRLVRDGKVLNINDDRALYLKFAENLAAAGVTGIGIDEANGYIHAGGGSTAAWGYRGRSNSSAFLPGDFKSAIEAGRIGERIETAPTAQEVPLSDAISEQAMSALDAEMRARMAFANQMVDRAQAAAEKRISAQQETNASTFMSRILAAGQEDPTTGQAIVPPTPQEVLLAQRNGHLTPDDSTAVLKALTTERADVTDQPTYRDLLTRVYNGEDIYQAAIAAGDRLRPEDLDSLLTKNNSLNRKAPGDAGKFDATQNFYFDNLKTRLGSRGLNDKWDQGKEDRKAMAQDEYRRRVLDGGEDPSAVADDIAARATAEEASTADGAISSLIIPRYAVQVPGQYRIEIGPSVKALNAARKAGQIKDADYTRTLMQLKEWQRLQEEAEKAAAAAKAERARKGNN